MEGWTDTPGDWLAILSIAVILLTALIWLIRAVNLQSKQMRPNGGNSMRDQIDVLVRGQRDFRDEITRIDGGINRLHRRIDDHLINGHDGRPHA